MRNKKRPLSVFLCHSHQDKPIVRQLYRQLLNEGIEPWLDEEKILGGQKWRVEIRKALRTADVVIVCLSHNSVNQAGYIQEEIEYVLDVADEQTQDTIFIIPVRLEDCPVPDRLRQLHWINLFDPNGFERLMSSLRRRAHSIGLIQTTNAHPQKQPSEKRPFLTMTSEIATITGTAITILTTLLAFLGYSALSSFWNNANEPNAANNRTPTSTIGTSGGNPPTATSTLTPAITNTPTSPTQTQVAVQASPSSFSLPSPGGEQSPALGGEASPAPGAQPIDLANADPAIVPNTQPLSAGGFEYSFGSNLTNIATGSYGGAPPSRGQYLIVLAWVRNTGATPQQIPDSFFVVKDAQDRVSGFNRAASVDWFNRFGGAGSAGDFGADAQLPPGAPLGSVPLFFDIYPDATDVVLFSRDNPNQGFRVR
ncbi:MAG TPA: toll/interleukin-1 receptor domain-containing protein [Herpetosiphonaceae bacterium]